MKMSGWGKYPVVDATVREAAGEEDVRRFLEGGDSVIARGMGRSYGDSSLNETMISMLGMNRFLAFDEEKGILTCEAGVTLDEILRIFVPRGWFLSVTPGTRYVTVGGAIASDVHGKNHHSRGSFSDHLISMDVMTADGKVESCSHKKNSELFHATAGGIGLTGIILRATFQLLPIESAYIRQKTIKARNLEEIIELFDEYGHYTSSGAWIDCLAKGNSLGRSILMVGEFAGGDEAREKLKVKEPLILPEKGPLSVPFTFPNFVLNSLSVRAFNFLYYNKLLKKVKDDYTTYNTHYYPLDSVLDWNRIYGRRGFTQYQFVLPREGGREGLHKIIKKIGDAGMGTFLLVLKQFAAGNKNYLSFPKEGYTLALDFPITRNLLPFLDELDDIVKDYDGRLYLTKDARMSPEMLRRGYDGLNQFEKVRTKYDKKGKFQSIQSRRLKL